MKPPKAEVFSDATGGVMPPEPVLPEIPVPADPTVEIPPGPVPENPKKTAITSSKPGIPA